MHFFQFHFFQKSPRDSAANDRPPAAAVTEPGASLGPPNHPLGLGEVAPGCSEASAPARGEGSQGAA